MSGTARVELGWAGVDLLAGLIRLGRQQGVEGAIAPTNAAHK